MRLIFLANARIPSEKAHPLQIMHMAEAFAAQRLEVVVLHARRYNTDAMRHVDNPFAYYGVAAAFALIGLPCLDLIKRVTIDWPVCNRGAIRLLAHLLQLVTFTLSALVVTRRLKGRIIYSRDLFPLTLTTLRRRRGVRTCFEGHTLPRSSLSQRLHLWAVRRVDRVVVISAALRRWYLSRGLPPERVLVAHDAAPSAAFDLEPRAAACRRMRRLSAMSVISSPGRGSTRSSRLLPSCPKPCNSPSSGAFRRTWTARDITRATCATCESRATDHRPRPGATSPRRTWR